MSSRVIFSLATPLARSAIALIRISGDDCLNRLRKILRVGQVRPRVATLVKILSPDGEILDEAVMTYFKAPKSFTGEDMVELSVHGNPLIIYKIFDILRSIGFYDAEPGEFSKRAYLSGKIDIIQAEALNMYISASSDFALKNARLGYLGHLSNFYSELRNKLLRNLAFLEAHIDFSEEDIGSLNLELLAEDFKKMAEEIRLILRNYNLSRSLLDGPRVLILGLPNAGKSSIFNLLLGYDRAIVSDIPGTTRDYLEAEIFINGFNVKIIDSAGIRDSNDPIERKGVELAYKNLQSSDLIFLVHDCGVDLSLTLSLIKNLNISDVVLILNKTDIHSVPQVSESDRFFRILPICALKPESRVDLIKTIENFLALRHQGDSALFALTSRQAYLLNEFVAQIDSLLETKFLEPLDVCCQRVRDAISVLDELIGKIHTDEILGEIFSKFCIGK